MKKSICIFISKNSNPDLYINIIGYLIEKHVSEKITHINLINVYDFAFEREEEVRRVSEIKTNILAQLEALILSQYFAWDFKNDCFLNKKAEVITITEAFLKIYQNIFNRIKEIDIQTYTILDDNIEIELTKLIKSKGEYFFDVTGLLTRYMVNVTMFLHNNNLNIHSFEIIRNREKGHRDLIHNLKKTDMNYPTLNPNNYRVHRSDFKDMMMSVSLSNVLNDGVEELKGMISRGKIDEVIKVMIKYSEGDINDKVIAISANWFNNENGKRKGIIDDNKYTLERNKIQNNLIILLKELKK